MKNKKSLYWNDKLENKLSHKTSIYGGISSTITTVVDRYSSLMSAGRDTILSLFDASELNEITSVLKSGKNLSDINNPLIVSKLKSLSYAEYYSLVDLIEEKDSSCLIKEPNDIKSIFDTFVETIKTDDSVNIGTSSEMADIFKSFLDKNKEYPEVTASYFDKVTLQDKKQLFSVSYECPICHSNNIHYTGNDDKVDVAVCIKCDHPIKVIW